MTKPPNIPDKITARLPVWLDRGEAERLKNALISFWNRVNSWIRWPLTQTDPLTCNEIILNLIAWQYDISRFNGESIDLFRKRVKFAFINAQDAGSISGFKNIFRRLEIGESDLAERVPEIDWDVILITLTAEQLSLNPWLLQIIVRQYGRTCRRYRYQVFHKNKITLRHGYIQGQYYCYGSSLIAPADRPEYNFLTGGNDVTINNN